MNKIAMVRIEFGFSESEVLADRVFTSWSEADRAIGPVAAAQGYKGYAKTDFTVIFADGETYCGRLDVNANSGSLADHVQHQCAFNAGHWHPDHMTDAQYQELLRIQARHGSSAEAYQAFLDTYQIGDPLPPVIALGAVKSQKVIEAWTPTDRLMMTVVGAFMGNEWVAGTLAEGSRPADLFHALAEGMEIIESDIIKEALLAPHRVR